MYDKYSQWDNKLIPIITGASGDSHLWMYYKWMYEFFVPWKFKFEYRAYSEGSRKAFLPLTMLTPEFSMEKEALWIVQDDMFTNKFRPITNMSEKEFAEKLCVEIVEGRDVAQVIPSQPSFEDHVKTLTKSLRHCWRDCSSVHDLVQLTFIEKYKNEKEFEIDFTYLMHYWQKLWREKDQRRQTIDFGVPSEFIHLRHHLDRVRCSKVYYKGDVAACAFFVEQGQELDFIVVMRDPAIEEFSLGHAAVLNAFKWCYSQNKTLNLGFSTDEYKNLWHPTINKVMSVRRLDEPLA